MSPFSRNMDYREQNDFEEQVRDSSYPPILKRMKKCHKLPSLNYIFPLSVYIQLHPKQAAPGHRHCISILIFLLLLLLHEVTEGKNWKDWANWNIQELFFVFFFLLLWVFFKSGNGDFCLHNFFEVKGGFRWLLLLGNVFQRIKALLSYKIRQDFNLNFLHTWEEKLLKFFLMDAGETTFLWLLLSFVVVTWWMYAVFCQLRWVTLFIWPNIQNQTLASKYCLTNNIVSETRQVPLLQ